ncbi:MAG: hypothetical protein ACE5H2_08495 [Terriglobia bacterium]
MNPTPHAAQPPMHPGRHLAAVEQFAYQLLCEASQPARTDAAPRLRAAALNPARLERAQLSSASLPGRDSIPLAYEIWLDYLFELDALLHYVQLSPRALTALELQGLQALARARTRFLRRHSFCPHCDAANPRPAVGGAGAAQRCAHCHKEL